MSRFLTLGLLLVTPGIALAQQGITWRTDPQPAVREAKATKRPLMVYVLAATRDRDDDVERGQRRALQDPRVLRLSRRFVPLRLSRSQHRDVLADFGLPQHANMMISFVSPDGKQLGQIGAGGVAQADSLVQKMVRVFEVYQKQLFDEEVRPTLKDQKAKPADVQRALALTREFRLTVADQAVVELLERPRLSAVLRKDAYRTLATLSTKVAVDKLLDLAWDGDADATDALSQCTPAGAELMLPDMQADAEYFPYPLYKAVTKICQIRKTKPERFFENASERLKQEEVERVQKLVRAAAQRWRSENAVSR